MPSNLQVGPGVYVWIFMGIILTIGLFLALRHFLCWYWKINEAVGVLQDILTKLDGISGALHGLTNQKPLVGALGEITESLQRIERLQKRSDREGHNTKEVETSKENDPELVSLSELESKEKKECSRCGSQNSNKVSRCIKCGAW